LPGAIIEYVTELECRRCRLPPGVAARATPKSRLPGRSTSIPAAAPAIPLAAAPCAVSRFFASASGPPPRSSAFPT